MKHLNFCLVGVADFIDKAMVKLDEVGHYVVAAIHTDLSPKLPKTHCFFDDIDNIPSEITIDYYIVFDSDKTINIDGTDKNVILAMVEGKPWIQHSITDALINGQNSLTFNWCKYHDQRLGVYEHCESLLKLENVSEAGDVYGKIIAAAVALLEDISIDLSREFEEINAWKSLTLSQESSPNISLDFSQPAKVLEQISKACNYTPYICSLGLPYVELNQKRLSIGELTCLESASALPPGSIISIDVNQIIISTSTKDIALSRVLPLSSQPINYETLINLHQISVIKTIDDLIQHCVPENEQLKVLSLFERLDKSLQRFPGRCALKTELLSLSYKELFEQVDSYATQLIDLGIISGDRVVVMLPRGEKVIISMLAIFKLGATYVYVSPDIPDSRIELILEDVNPTLLISTASVKSLIQDLLPAFTKCLFVEDIDCRQNQYVEVKDFSLNNVAYIIYTSGSTGKPKGVLVPYSSLAWLFNSTELLFDFNQNDTWIQLHSFSFDFSIWEIFGALTTGGCLFMPSNDALKNMAVIAELMISQGITVLNQTPSAFSLLINHSEEKSIRYPDLRYVIFGGENIRENDIQRWFTAYGDEKPKLINMYGITEVTVHATFCHLKQNTEIQSCIGKPLPAKYIYLLDEALRPARVGEEAEIFIGGEGLFLSYLDSVELTQKKCLNTKFLTGNEKGRLYKTGDFAVQTASGQLIYKGRSDQQVKILGHRVELDEIASAMRNIPSIKDAVVLESKTSDNFSTLVGFYIQAEPTNQSLLLATLKEILPDYMLPTRLISVNEFPMDKNGKLDQHYLLSEVKTKENPELGSETDVSLTLKKIWHDLLNKEPFNEAEFFSEGGSSLLAMQLISRISVALNISLTMREVMTHTMFYDLHHLLKNKSLLDKKTSLMTVNQNSKQYPLSAQQRAVYLLDGYIGSGNYSYNVVVKLDFVGIMNIDALTKSIDFLIDRHPMLRAVFLKDNDQIIQKITDVDETPLTIQYFDLENDNPEDTIVNFGRLTFSLSKAPLIKFLLLTNKQEKHVLLLKLHHIIHDGWSINILRNELAQAYNAFCENKLPSLTPIENTYADYVTWQSDLLAENKFVEQETSYWKKTIKHKTYYPLPFDFERPFYPTIEGEHRKIFFDRSFSTSLKHYAIKNRTSLPVIFLAAISIVLRKYSGSNHATIGMPVANRVNLEFENIIGLFANVLPIQIGTDPSSSLTAVLEEAKRVSLGALDHSKLPFSEIVSSLDLSRTAYANPVFQMVFVYHNAHQLRQQVPFNELQCQPVFANNKASKFDLTLEVLEYEDTFLLDFEYSTALFKESTINSFYEHVNHVLAAFLSDDQQLVNTLDILSSSDINLYRDLFSCYKPHIIKQTIFDRFEETAKQYPEAVALSYQNKNLSYREVHLAAIKTANALQQELAGMIKTETSSAVALLFPPSPELIITMLALLKLGIAYVPLDPRFPDERIKFILADAKVKSLLTTKELCLCVNSFCQKVISFENLNTKCKPELIQSTVPNNVAYIIYTSGTTGQPKGVPICQDQLLAVLESTSEHIKISRDDATILAHNAAFDVSVWEIFFTLLHGSRLTILPNEYISDIARFFDILATQRITYLSQTPSSFSRLVKYASTMQLEKLSDIQIHSLIFAGEPIQYNPIMMWSSLVRNNINYYNLYGITEGAIHCMLKPITPDVIEEKRNFIGKPLSNNCVVLTDGFHQLVPKNVIGEICLSGDSVMTGYLNDNLTNAEKFFTAAYFDYPSNRWFKTGDYAKLLDNGELEYVSRKDDQVKVYGYRVNLSEIELLLSRLSCVRRSSVLFDESEGLPALYVFISLNYAVDKSEIRRLLEDHLPYFMQPKELFIINYFPLTNNGKVDFPALKEIVHKRSSSQLSAGSQSRSEIQKTLISIWETVLKKKVDRVDMNFFDMGGHSLLLLSVIDEIKEQIGFELDVVELFKYPSILLLSNYISSKLNHSIPESREGRRASMVKKRDLLRKKKGTSRGGARG